MLRGLLAGDVKNRRVCALPDHGRSFKEQIDSFPVRVPAEQQNDGVLVLEAECCARLAALLRVVHEPIDSNRVAHRWTFSCGTPRARILDSTLSDSAINRS
jgi:hypothetical protein